MIRKDKRTTAADWREEYDELEQDGQLTTPHSLASSVETEPLPPAEVNMSQLLEHAKVKEEKLQSGYDFIASPASKVVVAEDNKAPPGDSKPEDDDWVDLKEEEALPRKDYSDAVKATKDDGA